MQEIYWNRTYTGCVGHISKRLLILQAVLFLSRRYPEHNSSLVHNAALIILSWKTSFIRQWSWHEVVKLLFDIMCNQVRRSITKPKLTLIKYKVCIHHGASACTVSQFYTVYSKLQLLLEFRIFRRTLSLLVKY